MAPTLRSRHANINYRVTKRSTNQASNSQQIRNRQRKLASKPSIAALSTKKLKIDFSLAVDRTCCVCHKALPYYYYFFLTAAFNISPLGFDDRCLRCDCLRALREVYGNSDAERRAVGMTQLTFVERYEKTLAREGIDYEKEVMAQLKLTICTHPSCANMFDDVIDKLKDWNINETEDRDSDTEIGSRLIHDPLPSPRAERVQEWLAKDCAAALQGQLEQMDDDFKRLEALSDLEHEAVRGLLKLRRDSVLSSADRFS